VLGSLVGIRSVIRLISIYFGVILLSSILIVYIGRNFHPNWSKQEQSDGPHDVAISGRFQARHIFVNMAGNRFLSNIFMRRSPGFDRISYPEENKK